MLLFSKKLKKTFKIDFQSSFSAISFDSLWCVHSIFLIIFGGLWIKYRKVHVHISTPCKITTLTDKNYGNESKIRLKSKTSQFYAHNFTSSIFDQKTHEFKHFPDTPRFFFFAGCYERLVIWWRRKTRLNTHLGKHQDILNGM
jgi:ABC-type nickel/cobalt efflux system permease component RcnA